MILAVEEPKEFSGNGKNGKPYHFFNRKLQIWTGSKAVECTIRKDKLEDHGQILIGSRATFRVVTGRVYNGQLSFDIDA
jgi:hypothetical protein